MPDGAPRDMQMTSFRPDADNARAFRSALGSFGTGVTIVTCRDAEGGLSIAANSFASVSLDPPLVLWCPAVAARRHDAFAEAETYSIHVLAEGQMDLCQQAANGGRDFTLGAWREDRRGVPILPDALARFDCTRNAAHPAGDHTILVGRVEMVTHREGTPLLFAQGAYGGFTNGV